MKIYKKANKLKDIEKIKINREWVCVCVFIYGILIKYEGVDQSNRNKREANLWFC